MDCIDTRTRDAYLFEFAAFKVQRGFVNVCLDEVRTQCDGFIVVLKCEFVLSIFGKLVARHERSVPTLTRFGNNNTLSCCESLIGAAVGQLVQTLN